MWQRIRRRSADVRLGVKIVVVSVAGSMIFAVLGVVSQVRLHDLSARQDGEYRTNVAALGLMTSTRSAIGGQQEAVLSYILSDAGSYRDAFGAAIATTDRTIDDSLTRLAGIGLPAEETKMLAAVRSDIEIWRKSRGVALTAAQDQNDRQGIVYTIVRLESVARAVKQSSDDLLNRLVEQVAAGAKRASTDSAELAQLMLVLGVISLVAALAIALILVRGISRPLSEVVDVLSRVASGDLSKKVTVRSRDEIGRMGEALNTTLEVLRHSFDAVQYQASHDSLTGLANRSLLQRQMQAAEQQARTSAGGAIVLLDLDGFKQVNDMFGHAAGDRVLTITAQRLVRTLRGADTVARLGGDEFAVLLTDMPGPAELQRLVEVLVEALEQPADFNGRTLSPRVSVGAALWEQGQGAEAVMRAADEALYLVKTVRKGIHPDRRRGRDWLAADLRAALEEEQFEVWYQPLVRLEDERPVGVEALVRWHHPEQGTISPAEFIPIAEHAGVIYPLGLWVLEQACRQVRAWQQHLPGGSDLYVSVNLSPQQLHDPKLVDDVVSVVRETGLDPRSLVLEVTESAIVDERQAVPNLLALRAHGVRIAIDDFGTGYSSLHYLASLPIDIVKIDQSLVSGLDGSPERAVIIEAVVHLSRVLRFSTVAEGIETTDQAAELRRLGCVLGQGYLWSPPRPAEDIRSHLTVLPLISDERRPISTV